MSAWQPGETAPQDGTWIVVFGQPSNLVIDGNELLSFKRPGIHMAAWDEIDRAFCLDGGSWLGPFIKPMLWMPLPEPPTGGDFPGG